MLQRFLSLFQDMPETEQEVHDLGALAACVILMEAATADDEFTDEERAHIVTVLNRRFELSDADAAALMEAAADKRAASADLWSFTRQLNDSFDVPQKIEIIEEVWRIVYSDGKLNGHEDHLAHLLRALLNLNHKQLIDAKLRVLEEIRGSN